MTDEELYRGVLRATGESPPGPPGSWPRVSNMDWVLNIFPEMCALPMESLPLVLADPGSGLFRVKIATALLSGDIPEELICAANTLSRLRYSSKSVVASRDAPSTS